MTTPHPSKDLIDAITSGAAAEVFSGITGDWALADGMNHALHHGAVYGWNCVRLKAAETHREKTVRYPVPMQVMPERGTPVWLVKPDCIEKWPWVLEHEDFLNAGLCYEIHREAEAKEAWQARFGEGWK